MTRTRKRPEANPGAGEKQRAAAIRNDDCTALRFDRMPEELRQRENWLLWRGGGSSKVPYRADQPTRKASCTDPATWTSFTKARDAYDPGRDAGVGFALAAADGLGVIDIDHNMTQSALDLLRSVGAAYVEVSPSGTGLHGWGTYSGELPRKKGVVDGINVEVYRDKRYMSVTGHVIEAGPFAPLQLAELSKNLQRADLQRQHKSFSVVSVVSVGTDELADFLPRSVGERNGRLFALARHLRRTMPDADDATLRCVVGDWHKLALPTIGTTAFIVSWDDFLRAWRTIRHPEGVGLAELLTDIENAALPTVPADYGPHALRLARICACLQARAGDDPFFLAARTAADLLDIHFTDAAAMLRTLRRDGVLELVSQGAGKKASRYRLSNASG